MFSSSQLDVGLDFDWTILTHKCALIHPHLKYFAASNSFSPNIFLPCPLKKGIFTAWCPRHPVSLWGRYVYGTITASALQLTQKVSFCSYLIRALSYTCLLFVTHGLWQTLKRTPSGLVDWKELFEMFKQFCDVTECEKCYILILLSVKSWKLSDCRVLIHVFQNSLATNICSSQTK